MEENNKIPTQINRLILSDVDMRHHYWYFVFVTFRTFLEIKK
jgi:hypothetical protein